MGSLAYAVGGGLAGLGEGLAKVGEQGFKEQNIKTENENAMARDTAHERLRDQFQKEDIANQQAFQTKSAETAATRAATAAGVTREFESGEKTKERESKEGIAARHETGATAREQDASNKKLQAAEARAAGARKPVAEFTHKTLTKAGGMTQGPDGKYVQTNGASYDLLNHRSGQGFVAVGDMYLPYSASDAQFPDPGKVGRAPADKLALLAQHPEKMMDFFQKYGYIPRTAVSALQQQKDQQQDKSLPTWAKGSTAGPETPLGAQAEAPDSDYQEEPNDYANTGDAGPQASDNTPAQ